MRPVLLAILDAIGHGLLWAGAVGLLASAIIAADWRRGWRKRRRDREPGDPYTLQEFRFSLGIVAAALVVAFVVGATVGAFDGR